MPVLPRWIIGIRSCQKIQGQKEGQARMPVLPRWKLRFTMSGISRIGNRWGRCFSSLGGWRGHYRQAFGANGLKKWPGKGLWDFAAHLNQGALGRCGLKKVVWREL